MLPPDGGLCDKIIDTVLVKPLELVLDKKVKDAAKFVGRLKDVYANYEWAAKRLESMEKKLPSASTMGGVTSGTVTPKRLNRDTQVVECEVQTEDVYTKWTESLMNAGTANDAHGTAMASRQQPKITA